MGSLSGGLSRVAGWQSLLVPVPLGSVVPRSRLPGATPEAATAPQPSTSVKYLPSSAVAAEAAPGGYSKPPAELVKQPSPVQLPPTKVSRALGMVTATSATSPGTQLLGFEQLTLGYTEARSTAA